MKRRHLEIIDTTKSTNENAFDRRHALQLLFAGAALTQSACSSSSTSTPASSSSSDAGSGSSSCDSPAGFDAGDVSGFASGTWTLVSGSDPFIVAQDDNGVFAFSAICTHQGCKVDAPTSTGSTTCPCHGSVFDGNGAVVKGPARTALPHYAVAICGGHVYVDSSTTVDASTRTTVS